MGMQQWVGVRRLVGDKCQAVEEGSQDKVRLEDNEEDTQWEGTQGEVGRQEDTPV